MRLSIYRYNPETQRRPALQDFEIEPRPEGKFLLDALLQIKDEVDDSLTLRRSCREGVCGSDGMNINGRNGLACVTPLKGLKEPVAGAAAAGPAGDPRPGGRHVAVLQAVYRSVKPYLQSDEPVPLKERLQAPADRAELDGLYECILCACCSTSCPSFWWNPDKFVGPAGLLQAYRFIADTRDTRTNERLDDLNDPYRLFRCHTIMNCVDACPKHLNPTKAIVKIKETMLSREI